MPKILKIVSNKYYQNEIFDQEMRMWAQYIKTLTLYSLLIVVVHSVYKLVGKHKWFDIHYSLKWNNLIIVNVGVLTIF